MLLIINTRISHLFICSNLYLSNGGLNKKTVKGTAIPVTGREGP
jgi:hypothetical protein